MSTNTKMTKKILSIFQEVQNRLAHQSNAAILTTLYDAILFEDFIRTFMHCIHIMFGCSIDNANVLSCMKFVSTFVTKVAERDYVKNDSEEAPTHPLLRSVIMEVIKYHNRENKKYRYHACNLITLLLESIGEDANLDNDLCDEIQDAMLDRIRDQSSAVRERAIEALQRLQDPCNKECPIIIAYLNSLKDTNSIIRAAVIKVVAPCAPVMPIIVESVHDTDPKVRLQAFVKLSQLRPNCLKIVERQAVLESGFDEANKRVNKVFREMLLPKWLSAYDGNYLLLLKAIKLDADERDIENTDEISNKIMEVFLKTHTIQDLISYLPLNEDKLIPYDKLLTEVALFWNIMLHTLKKMVESDEAVMIIVPDLLPFCNYVDRYITEKSSKDLQQWQYLEYQFILLKLFDMIQTFDVSDEAGRKVLHQLVTETLLKRSLGKPVIRMLLSILEKLNCDLDSLIEEVIGIIRNILDPIIEVQPSKENLHEYNFKIAELDVKINVLYEEVEEAVIKKDMILAAKCQEVLEELKVQKADIQSKIVQPRQEKQSFNDPKHKYKAFDILNSLLELDSVIKLNNTLKSFRKEILTEMETSVDNEHHKRVFMSCCLYALLDRECAQEYLKFIYSPVLVYRTMPEITVITLQKSMMMICDLLYIYGPQLFKSEDSDTHSNTVISKRKLYNPDIEEMKTVNCLECSAEFLIDIILSMLTSDVPEIKETACKVLARLIYSGICISSGLFTRVLIEWCNPVNIQVNPDIQTMLGMAMFHYANHFEDSQVVLENSVIPTLNVIGNAPKTSPLADVNIDNVIEFMCNLTKPLHNNSIVDTHKTLAYMLCNTLDKNLEDKCAIIWAKTLFSLDLPQNDKKALEELKTQVGGLLEDVNNKTVKKKLKMYVAKINAKQNTETEIILEVNSNIAADGNETQSNLQQKDQNKSDKRLASGSDNENSAINPRKKPKLNGTVELHMDNTNTRSAKRNLNNSTSFQEDSVTDKRQNEKRQKLQNDVNSGEQVDSVRSKRSVEQDTNSEHDMKVVLRETRQNKYGANILQNLLIKPSQTVKPTKKDNQPIQDKSPKKNNASFSKTKLNRSKINSSTSLSTSIDGIAEVNKNEQKKLRKAIRIKEKDNCNDFSSSEEENAVDNKKKRKRKSLRNSSKNVSEYQKMSAKLSHTEDNKKSEKFNRSVTNKKGGKKQSSISDHEYRQDKKSSSDAATSEKDDTPNDKRDKKKSFKKSGTDDKVFKNRKIASPRKKSNQSQKDIKERKKSSMTDIEDKQEKNFKSDKKLRSSLVHEENKIKSSTSRVGDSLKENSTATPLKSSSSSPDIKCILKSKTRTSESNSIKIDSAKGSRINGQNVRQTRSRSISIQENNNINTSITRRQKTKHQSIKSASTKDDEKEGEIENKKTTKSPVDFGGKQQTSESQSKQNDDGKTGSNIVNHENNTDVTNKPDISKRKIETLNKKQNTSSSNHINHNLHRFRLKNKAWVSTRKNNYDNVSTDKKTHTLDSEGKHAGIISEHELRLGNRNPSRSSTKQKQIVGNRKINQKEINSNVEEVNTFISNKRMRSKNLGRTNLKSADGKYCKDDDIEESRNVSIDSLKELEIQINHRDIEKVNTHLKSQKTKSSSERDNRCLRSNRIAKKHQIKMNA